SCRAPLLSSKLGWAKQVRGIGFQKGETGEANLVPSAAQRFGTTGIAAAGPRGGGPTAHPRSIGNGAARRCRLERTANCPPSRPQREKCAALASRLRRRGLRCLTRPAARRPPLAPHPGGPGGRAPRIREG